VQKPPGKVVLCDGAYAISKDTSAERHLKQSYNGAGITPLKTQGN
jgi:hypothetical protein